MQYTAEFLKKVYRDLLSVRLFEEKQVEVYALGKVPGHIHSGIGEEAVCTGVMATRKEGDYFKISHRPVGAGLVLGAPLETMFAELMGKSTGNAKGLGGVLHMTSFQHGMVGFSGTLGSDMNRLEHTLKVLSYTTENLTDALSVIRDTDMAEEMTELTKQNILSQTSQSMLAQANQTPQGVLQLLK